MANIFNKIKINIASPEKILSWSHGEVQIPDTINYRTLKPVTNGLFDERIFGPIKDYTCSCGKYRSAKIPGKVCEKCGVELTTSLSRRDRMGHITLNTPIVHSYYYKGQTSIIGSLLGIKSKDITDVVLHNKYLVLEEFKDTIDGEPIILHKNTVIVESEYRRLRNASKGRLKAQMGGEGIKYALEHLDIDVLIESLLAQKEKTKQEAEIKKINKRLKIAYDLKESGNKPEWMVMDYLPVLPPDLRPMTQTQNAKFAVADLNELYKNVIVRNNRLGELLDNAFTPEVIRRNERRLLQLSVDALINNEDARNKKNGKKEFKSLTENLKGKHGRLRQNLLGKRVDYSGRSVITIEPSLNMNQCGLPKDMAMELFKPMVCSKLLETGDALNIKKANTMIKEGNDLAWDALAEVIKDYPVLLNRAPTLHRLGIQAFQPILVEGKSIRLHPLVCTAFNADFDGDQMAVHVPLSLEAQAECKALMSASGNLLKPSDGAPIAVPSQDMVLGVYYLTMKNDIKVEPFSNLFKDVNEALLAYENKKIKLQDPIKVRREITNNNGEKISGIIETTLGRCIFNDIIPQDIGIIERITDEDLIKLEVDYLVGKKQLKQLLKAVIDKHGIEKASKFLDDVKNMGYKYSTKAAITVSISDMIVPESKEDILEEAEKEVQLTKDDYMSGFLTEEERHKQTLNIWKKADGQIKDELLSGLGEYNNIFIMANSGARGSEDQIKQLAGMRGNMSATGNKVIELPIKSNFREGLNVLEYFISAHGARKALSDTALKTADAGYLTRRLVDLSQELIITEWDCSENDDEVPYTEVNEIKEFGNQIESLESRIIGKLLAEDKGIYKKNTLITPSIAKTLTKDNNTLKIRTPRSCKSKSGICCKCYGTNLATGEIAEIGDAVGVIAAQSIGEPGTQLTMRTFHTGGIATGDDITTGLPRVEEIFEARNPKGEAILAPIDGTCSIIYDNDNTYIEISSDSNTVKIDIPFIKKSVITVKEGEYVNKGALLTKGSANLNNLMQIAGKNAVEEYVIKEIQNVYKGRGVDINDKHIEVMLKSMFRNVSIIDPGDTNLSVGDELNEKEVIEINEKLTDDKTPAQYEPILYGLTKAVQKSSKSFLSAASSRETKNVLSHAAFRGEVDTLDDIKSNVIIGSLIPAGTGLI